MVCSSNRSHVGEELEGGIGVLAVFGEVKSLELGLGRDAQDAEALEDEEDRAIQFTKNCPAQKSARRYQLLGIS